MYSGNLINLLSNENMKQLEIQRANDLMAKEAEIAAAKMPFRVYNLTHSNAEKEEKSADNDSLTFYVLGCAGNASQAQKEVAALMEYIAKNPANKPKYIIITGDNFYDWGVNSPLDPMFKSNFYDIYADLLLKNLCDIPCFVALGNHDENIHRLRLPLQEKGVDRGMHQVAHSYLPEKKGEYNTTEKKVELYSRSTLDVTKLPKWNMPSRAYSLIDGNTQIFFIDSNTYVGDYLAYANGENVDKNTNQAAWLEEEMKEAKKHGRRVLLVGHHPLYTPGSRAYESDVTLYLSGSQIQDAKKRFPEIDNHDPYNNYLRNCFKQQKLEFDAVFAAHDHNISYYNNNNLPKRDYPLCQITAGGGGGGTQKRKKFSNQEQMGCFLKEHGFVMVKCDKNDTSKMLFSIHAAKGKYHHLYSNQHCQAICTYSPDVTKLDRLKIEELFKVIRLSINQYFSFIGDLQDQHHGGFFKKNMSHGYEGIQRVHDVWSYINNDVTYDFRTTLENVHNMTKWTGRFSMPSEHSFITILNKALKEAFGEDIDALLKREALRIKQ